MEQPASHQQEHVLLLSLNKVTHDVHDLKFFDVMVFVAHFPLASVRCMFSYLALFFDQCSHMIVVA
jgi:hypothetical protein